MDRVELLKRWQPYNPATGQFDRPRTNREYADLLGIHESYLSKAYAGLHPVGLKALAGLAQAFPAAAGEVGSVLASRPVPAEVA